MLLLPLEKLTSLCTPTLRNIPSYRIGQHPNFRAHSSRYSRYSGQKMLNETRPSSNLNQDSYKKRREERGITTQNKTSISRMIEAKQIRIDRRKRFNDKNHREDIVPGQKRGLRKEPETRHLTPEMWNKKKQKTREETKQKR